MRRSRGENPSALIAAQPRWPHTGGGPPRLDTVKDKHQPDMADRLQTGQAVTPFGLHPHEGANGLRQPTLSRYGKFPAVRRFDKRHSVECRHDRHFGFVVTRVQRSTLARLPRMLGD